jgi:predicted GNAT family N-acyltransferase
MPDFRVRSAAWHEEQVLLMTLREQVFVLEQGVPLELERDEFDATAFHVVAENRQGRAIGTGRLLEDARIGRMCVLSEYRGRGVGASILAALVREARRRGVGELTLHAQLHALRFYEKLGWVATGEGFSEAGILHRAMSLRLH